MAGTGPGDLHGLAEDFLDACVQALDTNPAPLLGAPARAFVSPGIPVWDCCEQLAVHVQSISDRYSVAPKAALPKLSAPLLVATITRCIPTGTNEGKRYSPPQTAALEASAAQINADGWALWNHIWNMIEDDAFLASCHTVTFEGMISAQPAGGCAGWVLNVRTVLDGYPETLGS